MKRHLDIVIPIIIIIAGALLMWALFTGQEISQPISYREIYGPKLPPIRGINRQEPSLPVVKVKPRGFPVEITQHSPEIFAYAHGTVMAEGKIFIGMAARSGNPFTTNQLYIFSNPNDLNQFKIISIQKTGDIESMILDEKNSKIYFTLSNNGSLEIYRIDPKSYFLSTVISTTSVNIGLKPAITTDGKYVYGISYTNPSTVFKIGLNGLFGRYSAPLWTSTGDHISNGHSAAIGVYASSTELYFGGGEDDGFEKIDANTLASIAKIRIPNCSITDDMPFKMIDSATGYGYVYIGCEREPYGYRVKTDDMSFVRFDLPGNSFGMYIFGNDLYNAAQDGHYDIFPGMDITRAKRYYVGKDIQLNELFMATTTKVNTAANEASLMSASGEATTTVESRSLLFTGWWGVKGLYSVDI